MSAAGPPQGARPPSGERRDATQGRPPPSAAGPPQGARPPSGERRDATQGGPPPSAAGPPQGARPPSGERRDATPTAREHYPWRRTLATRWADNDAYGHVNNVVYYAWFDTVINEHLIAEGGLDLVNDAAIGVVVETGCRFHRSLAFPAPVEMAIRVASIGTSSVVYEIGVFDRDDPAPAATGRFVHVWVDRAGRRPVPVPPRIRAALERIRA